MLLDLSKGRAYKQCRDLLQASLNREVIAYARLTAQTEDDDDDDVLLDETPMRPAHDRLPVLLEKKATTLDKGLKFYHSLTFEYAGVTLVEFTEWHALDPVQEFLGPVLDALQFLHSRGVLHTDVNPFNLCASSSRDGGRVVVKLVDLGSSVVVGDGRGTDATASKNDDDDDDDDEGDRWMPRVAADGSLYLMDGWTSLPTTQPGPPTATIAAATLGGDADPRSTTTAVVVDRCVREYLCNIPHYREPLANAALVATTREAVEVPDDPSPLSGVSVDGSSDAYAAAMVCTNLCRGSWPTWGEMECLGDLDNAGPADVETKKTALFVALRRNPAFDPVEFADAVSVLAMHRGDLSSMRRADNADDDEQEQEKQEQDAAAQTARLKEFATTLSAVGYAAHSERAECPDLLNDVAEIHGRQTAELLSRLLCTDRARRRPYWQLASGWSVSSSSSSSSSSSTSFSSSSPFSSRSCCSSCCGSSPSSSSSWSSSSSSSCSRSRTSSAHWRATLSVRVKTCAKTDDRGRSKVEVFLGRCWLATGVLEPPASPSLAEADDPAAASSSSSVARLTWWKAAAYLSRVDAPHATSALCRFIEEAVRVAPSLGSTSPEKWPVESAAQSRAWRTLLALHRAMPPVVVAARIGRAPATDVVGAEETAATAALPTPTSDSAVAIGLSVEAARGIADAVGTTSAAAAATRTGQLAPTTCPGRATWTTETETWETVAGATVTTAVARGAAVSTADSVVAEEEDEHEKEAEEAVLPLVFALAGTAAELAGPSRRRPSTVVHRRLGGLRQRRGRRGGLRGFRLTNTRKKTTER